MLEPTLFEDTINYPSTKLKEILLLDKQLQIVYEKVNSLQDKEAGHDFSHVLRVARLMLYIGENEISTREGVAAALLHDLINIPKNSPDRSKASELSSELAHNILDESDFLPDESERIAKAIKDHSFSRSITPNNMLGRVLQDADRIDALGAIGILRAATTGERMKCAYYHFTDPWGITRELDDSLFTIDHFFTKLKKLPKMMHTQKGRIEAQRRFTFMEFFLKQLGYEIGVFFSEQT